MFQFSKATIKYRLKSQNRNAYIYLRFSVNRDCILEKTKKNLKTGLPYKISIQKFNEYIKEICRLSEIDDIIKGIKSFMIDENGKIIPKDKKDNYTKKGVKRTISRNYPKWQFMAYQVCRRSFASNLYENSQQH